MPGVELLKQRLAQLEERIDALSLKERLLLLGALLLVLAYAWEVRLLAPLEAKRKAMAQEVSSLNQSLHEIDASTTDWTRTAVVDPDAATRVRLASLTQQLVSIKSSVEARTGQMVSPEQMPLVLKNVLSRFKDLEFDALEGLAAEPVLDTQAPGEADTTATAAPALAVPAKAPDAQAAYKHGIRIRFSGSYREATAYLQALEALPYGFFWDRVELDASDFPRVRGSLVVYTVSLRAGWIGV